MNPKIRTRGILAAVLGLLLIVAGGCSERETTGLDPVPVNDNPVVFDDNFSEGLDYHSFDPAEGADTGALSMDNTEFYDGTFSLKVTIPDPGSPNGTWAGGAFVNSGPRDLSGYNALTFWAKASMNATLDVAGLGNDNTGTSLYTAERADIPIGTDWAYYVIPVPNPARLDFERGLFFFAEGPEGGLGYELWFDEIKFADVASITNPRPVMDDQTLDTFIGGTATIQGTSTTFDDGRADILIDHMSGYFDLVSSDEGVVTAGPEGITAVGGGTATVTAMLDAIPVVGTVTMNVIAPPAESAPAPTHAAEDVICLFSDSYDDITVDTWAASWGGSTAEVSEFDLAVGDVVKAYTSLNFAGITFENDMVDATELTHFHLDVYAPAGTDFTVTLVDFGADGAYGGSGENADSEGDVTFDASTTPAFVTGQWVLLDIPLADFMTPEFPYEPDLLQNVDHLAQLKIESTDATTVFVDNVYFHQ